MSLDNSSSVVVFPLASGAFRLRPDWFETYSTRMTHPAYLVMTLLLVTSVGIMALRRFENADFEKKAWNIPVILTAVAFWPYLVLGLKSMVDTFNSFLVQDIFRIDWSGFGFLNEVSTPGLSAWSLESLVRLLPYVAYWIIFTFYTISFFFYAVLGPLIMVKGVLTDEIESFLELVKELVLLFMWQTTLVVLVSFLMPEIVSGKPFPPHPPSGFYFNCLILGVMIFFVPALTRKFGSHLGSSFIPLGFRYGGAAIGLNVVGGFAGAVLGSAGLPIKEGGFFSVMRERISKGEEFKSRYEHKKHAQDLEVEQEHAHEKIEEQQHAQEHARQEMHPHQERSEEDLVDLAKKAKTDHEEPHEPET